MPKDVLDVRGVLQFYEYGVEDYPSPSQAVRYEREPLGLQPAHEIISLSDYRRRHALYRMDRGLQVSISCVFRINMCCACLVTDGQKHFLWLHCFQRLFQIWQVC